MPSLSSLRARIATTKSTNKITHAMQFISASRFKQFSNSFKIAHSYYQSVLSELISVSSAGYVNELMKKTGGFLPFKEVIRLSEDKYHAEQVLKSAKEVGYLDLEKKEEIYEKKKHLTIFIAAERGLCGKYNSSLVKHLYQHIVRNLKNKEVSIFAIGNKAKEGVSNIEKEYRNGKKHEVFAYHLPKSRTFANIKKEIIDEIFDILAKGEYLTCDIVYSKFHSATSQEPKTLQIWPMSRLLKEAMGLKTLEYSEIIDYEANEWEDDDAAEEYIYSKLVKEYDFEKASEGIMKAAIELEEQKNIKYDSDPIMTTPKIIQQYLISKIYRIIHESQVSENAARMVAMDSAHRNSEELIKKLDLVYNSTRQAQITAELIEIISGSESING